MKKWAETENITLSLENLKKTLSMFDFSSFHIVSDTECDGIISKTSYHDGTEIFTYKLIGSVLDELRYTNTKSIGTITLQKDYVFCDMSYGENQKVTRDVVCVGFKY